MDKPIECIQLSKKVYHVRSSTNPSQTACGYDLTSRKYVVYYREQHSDCWFCNNCKIITHGMRKTAVASPLGPGTTLWRNPKERGKQEQH